jgi:uncharacterized membrane protein YidH (DUF202 family)
MTERDPGLQPERTALAWQRTGLAAVVLAVLLLRHGVLDRAPLEIMAGVLAAAAALLSGFAIRVRSEGAPRFRLILVTAAVVAAGACTTVQLVLG